MITQDSRWWLQIHQVCRHFLLIASGCWVGSCATQAQPNVTFKLLGQWAPTLISSVQAVQVVGQRAYVGLDQGGVVILDISQPEMPAKLGGYDTGGAIGGMAVVGNYAYVADDTAGLLVLDVSNPAKPQRVGEYSPASPDDSVLGVAVSGNYAYVLQWMDGLQVIEVSNPANPRRMDGYQGTGNLMSIAVSGNYVFLGSFLSSSLEIIDVSNPSDPRRVGGYQTSGQAWGVALSGHYAFVAAGELAVLDVSNPANPQRVGGYAAGQQIGVAVSGNYAFLFGAGLQVFDITNPATPKWLARYATGDAIRGLVAAGNTAYMAVDNSGLVILQVDGLGSGAVAPAITQQPQGQTCKPGDAVTLQVQATGTPPLYYQWSFNGAHLLNQTNGTLVLTTVTTNRAGIYSVTISNQAGMVISSNAVLKVLTPINVSITPWSPTTLWTNVGATVVLTGGGANSGSYACRWQKDGVVISGATNTTLMISNAHPSDSGNYQFFAEGPEGYGSAYVTLTIGSLAQADRERTFVTLAGPAELGPGAVDATGTATRFNHPAGLTADSAGNVYVADAHNHTIRKIDPRGVVTTLAGLARNWGSSDGIGGAARFAQPFDAALDSLGNLYVVERGNSTIRIIHPGGEVLTLAGQAGNLGSADGAGSAARFETPEGVALDSAGNAYVADTYNHTVRVIRPGGVVTTLAGLAGSSGSVDGVGSAARFYLPKGIVADIFGNVYVAERGNHTIRKISAGGVVTTVAGKAGDTGSADGPGSAARFNGPFGVALDSAGMVYVADTYNHTIRKISPGALVTTVAGLAEQRGNADGTGSAARFNQPYGVTADNHGNLYVADWENDSIRKIGPGGVVTTVAGLAGNPGSADGAGSAAGFNYPYGVAVDGTGHVYVADSNNNAIRKIDPDGTVTTVAGSAGSSGSTDGTGISARFNQPYGVAADNHGNLYVADSYNHTIRKIGPGLEVTTIAGLAGNPGSTEGAGSAARFNFPFGVAVDGAGNLYVADSRNHTIRKISPGVEVTTVAGSAGNPGSTDGTGSAARFNYPYGVAVDGAGNLYVADWASQTIRKVGPGGVVTTVAGLAGSYGTMDAIGSQARFAGPWSLALDTIGNLYVAEEINIIRKIDSAGAVTTVAGLAWYSGSADGTAGMARFNGSFGVAADNQGNLYVADASNHRIRKSVYAAPDEPIVDQASGTVGVVRQLNVAKPTATQWAWQIIRRPSGSAAELSSSTVRNPTFTPDVADLWIFQMRATNASGEIAIRNLEFTAKASLSVPPAIVQQPQSQAYTPGDNVTLLVQATGPPPLYYQWSFNGTPLLNQTNATLVLAAMTMSQAGIYSVTVSNEVGMVGSSNAVLSLTPGNTEYTWVTLAGSAAAGSGAADGTGSAARFKYPAGVAVDGAGNVWVADMFNQTIRKISPAGVVTTVAGLTGSSGYADGTGSAARFNYPAGVAVDGGGNVYIADNANHAIRKLTPNGVVTTLAGMGVPGAADGPARTAQFYYPESVAVDGAGNVLVADSANYTIRKITPAGVVTTLAGAAGKIGAVDGPASTARFNFLEGVAVDGTGNVYVVDQNNYTIRKISPAGVVTTLAGLAGSAGYADGKGSLARFSKPAGVAVDSAGSVYVADQGNGTVRKISPEGMATTIGGSVLASKFTSADGTGNEARFLTPIGVAVDGAGTVYVADYGNHTIRKSIPAAPDKPVIDWAAGPVGVVRQLDTSPQTADRWRWSLISNPAYSLAGFSSDTIRNPTFTPDLPDLYRFQLQATNSMGGVSIRYLEFRAGMAPSIIQQPQSQAIPIGSPVTFRVVVNGTAPIFYQWQKNGLNLGSQTNAVISLAGVGLADAGGYSVVVSNAYGSLTSSLAVLEVGMPPAFSQQPQSQALTNGASLVLFAPALGVEPIRYQWFFSNAPLANARSFQLSITNLGKTNTGPYYVSASNIFGVTRSFTAAVSILPPLKITQVKTTNLLNPGDSLILPLPPLNMENSGPGPFNYQWQINGEAVPNATNATYPIPSAKPGDGGSYRVIVASGAEAVAVDIADVIVQARPVVAGDNFSDRIPLLATNGLGGVVSATNLLATREAGEPEHAGKKGSNSIWFKWVAPTNGNATFSTAGSTFDTLLAVYTGANVGTLVPVASDEDRGGYLTSKLQFPAANGVEYQVAVDGFAGAAGRVVLEWGVEATTDLLPGIVTNPAPQMVALGQNAQFEVQATGANLRYQWFRNDQPLPGASQSRLVITNVQVADMGNYLVQVINAAGSKTNTSAGALLEVFEVLEGQTDPVQPGQDKVEDLAAGISLGNRLEVRWGAVKRLGLPFSSGYSLSVYSENNQATTQWLENQRGSGIVGHSRWHWLEVQVDGICTLSTEGSEFDTVLELYLLEGRELSLVGSDDNGGADGRTSRLVGRVAEGGHYYVRVAGKNEAQGRYKLSSRLEPLQEYRQWGYQAGQGFVFTLRVPREATFTVDTTTDLKAWQPLFTTNSASGKYDLLTTGLEPQMFYRALLYLPPSAQTTNTGQVGGK